MSTLQYREPYTNEELEKLYPSNLKLQHVQIFHRHGERTPTGARFENTGLAKFWPYCSVAREMMSPILETNNGNAQWSSLFWQRQLETMGADDRAVPATGPTGDNSSLCKMGELTNIGRITTYKLGQRLRHLYVDQLNFLPEMLEDTNLFYFRSSPFPRALESLQQVFRGMYPANTRASSLGPLSIITRHESDENLYNNYYNCKRFSQLSKAFTQRSVDRWNKSTEMDYVNKLLSKWMPESCRRVAIDSHPRLSGIMDTINSTSAHGPETRLPNEFYDPQLRKVIDKVCVDEWFSGYMDSNEYRTLGIGSLMGDVVDKMASYVDFNRHDGSPQLYHKDKLVSLGRNERNTKKFNLNGCHDTTLAAILISLGAFGDRAWPPFTSHIAFELFQKSSTLQVSTPKTYHNETAVESRETGNPESNNLSVIGESSLVRKKIQNFNANELSLLDGYFVRVRYNDEVVIIPGCKKEGNHLDGDESFCSLEVFKSIVDKFVPLSRKNACQANIDAPAFPTTKQPAGY